MDCMIVNSGPVPATLLQRYAEEMAHPVALDLESCLQYVPQVVQADLVATGSLLRHDSKRLARLVLQVARSWPRVSGVEAGAATPMVGA